MFHCDIRAYQGQDKCSVNFHFRRLEGTTYSHWESKESKEFPRHFDAVKDLGMFYKC